MTRRASETLLIRVAACAHDRERAFAIRRRVFQDEQRVPADEEFDADDERAIHLLAEIDGTAVATGRIVFRTTQAKIGRMAVLPAFRRRGVGRRLLQDLVRIATEHRFTHLVLNAQVGAIAFYEAAGFRVVSDEFSEVGIPHRRMERTLNQVDT